MRSCSRRSEQVHHLWPRRCGGGTDAAHHAAGGEELECLGERNLLLATVLVVRHDTRGPAHEREEGAVRATAAGRRFVAGIQALSSEGTTSGSEQA